MLESRAENPPIQPKSEHYKASLANFWRSCFRPFPHEHGVAAVRLCSMTILLRNHLLALAHYRLTARSTFEVGPDLTGRFYNTECTRTGSFRITL